MASCKGQALGAGVRGTMHAAVALCGCLVRAEHLGGRDGAHLKRNPVRLAVWRSALVQHLLDKNVAAFVMSLAKCIHVHEQLLRTRPGPPSAASTRCT